MKIFSLIALISLWIVYAMPQSCKFLLQDSAALSVPLQVDKNELNMLSCTVLDTNVWIVIGSKMPTVYRFSFCGKKQDSLILSQYMTFKIKPNYVYLTTHNNMLLLGIANQFLLYDPTQKTYKNIQFNSQKTSFYIDGNENCFNFTLYKNQLIVPLDRLKIINTYSNYAKNRFLFGLCDTSYSNIKVVRTFANIDSIYQKMYLRHIMGRYFYIDTVKKYFYISQEATHKIDVIDLNTYKQVNSFGTPYKWASKNFVLQPYYHDIDPFILYSQYVEKRIESNLSKEIFIHNGRIYRTYTIAIKDTTTHKVMNKQEYKTYLKTHKRTCSSALPDIVVNQVRLEQSKPYGLQIYNEKYELIFDEIMPTPFNILKIENNELWVHGRYDEANQKYWIYKYKIKIEHSKP